VEKYLVEAVAAAGGLCLKFVSPGHAGVPDRLVILDGVVRFVEVKRPKEKLRKLQVQCADLLRKHGLVVDAVFSKKDVVDYINRISPL
jgi:hypothetical protein